jgi:hypothetical protein
MLCEVIIDKLAQVKKKIVSVNRIRTSVRRELINKPVHWLTQGQNHFL